MMSESEPSVADFYAPVLAGWPVEVQRLVVRHLSRDFKQVADLEEAILAVARNTVKGGPS
jgi:hypothetical protein